MDVAVRFRQFEVFYAVMTAGSVSAAAQRLGVSQPSVTKTLKQLEDELGYLLFDRVKGRLQATEEARALMREAERAQAALDDLRDVAKRLRQGSESHLRIVATPALGQEVLPDAVMAGSAGSGQAGRVRFTISTLHSGDVLREIAKPTFGYDLGFIFDASQKPASVGATQIGAAPLACVAQPGTFARRGPEIALEDLVGKTLIGLDETEPLGRMLADISASSGLITDVAIRVQTYWLACGLAQRGAGVAVVDAMTATSFALHNNDVEARRLPAHLTLPVNAVYPLARGLPVRSKTFVARFEEALARRLDQFTDLLSTA